MCPQNGILTEANKKNRATSSIAQNGWIPSKLRVIRVFLERLLPKLDFHRCRIPEIGKLCREGEAPLHTQSLRPLRNPDSGIAGKRNSDFRTSSAETLPYGRCLRFFELKMQRGFSEKSLSLQALEPGNTMERTRFMFR